MKVRAASALLPTLFPSPTGSRLSPSSSHGAIHVMAQTGRSNARYVDPQRRYTVVLGPSWNAPFGALPHNDRAGTHDGADGRCGSYARIGGGQAAMWITSKNFVAGCPSMSALPPKADMEQTCRHVRFVPKADYCSAEKPPIYSITSSARANQDRIESAASVLSCLKRGSIAPYAGPSQGYAASASRPLIPRRGHSPRAGT